MKSEITYLRKTELFKELEELQSNQFFAMVDSKVKNQLPEWIQKSSTVFWINAPESEKKIETFTRALEFFLESGIQRSSQIIAIGGGATTDLAGFVASALLRGIEWVAIPTTLLAMIDGSIGGKTAINMPQGKNLVGSFHLPKKVLICGEFLSTLPEDEWFSGKGELLKYAFLSKKINDLILNHASMDEIAYACAQFKEEIVERDLTEQGDRILLNLGHSLGHAFESTLKIPHGKAVALGLYYLFEIMNLPQLVHELQILMEALGMNPVDYKISKYPQFNLESFLSYLKYDKKSIDSKIKLILVKEVGNCFIQEYPLADLKEKIKDHVDFKN
ncbi:MAG: 3-dehydroquinate synthase family protein [Bacteriovoracaceae bacterium]